MYVCVCVYVCVHACVCMRACVCVCVQHQRAHKDPIALNYSFYAVLTADERMPSQVRDLRNRCLDPGMYAQHLMHWLDYFPARQVSTV